MGARIDLSGQTFNNWHVNQRVRRKGSQECLWDCTCLLCGKNYTVGSCSLRSGTSKMCRSCSAKLRPEIRERATEASKKSGLSTTKLYQVLANAHRRCEDPKNGSYNAYGARGISVCDEWSMKNVRTFYDWAIANGYKEGLELDRMDVNGNYCPDNCRWVSRKENQRNRRDNFIVEAFGEKITLAEAVEKYSDLPYGAVRYRITRYGYSVEEALTKPLRKTKQNEGRVGV